MLDVFGAEVLLAHALDLAFLLAKAWFDILPIQSAHKANQTRRLQKFGRKHARLLERQDCRASARKDKTRSNRPNLHCKPFGQGSALRLASHSDFFVLETLHNRATLR